VFVDLEASVKTILEKLESLAEDQRDLKDKLRIIQAQSSRTVDVAVVFNYPPLPLKNEEELERTECCLEDPVQYQQLVN